MYIYYFIKEYVYRAEINKNSLDVQQAIHRNNYRRCLNSSPEGIVIRRAAIFTTFYTRKS